LCKPSNFNFFLRNNTAEEEESAFVMMSGVTLDELHHTSWVTKKPRLARLVGYGLMMLAQCGL